MMRKMAALSISMIVAGGVAAQDGKQDPAKGSGSNAAKNTPVVVTVMTVALAESTGCWAKVYDGHDFNGRSLMLNGAQSLPHLEFGIGYDWKGSIDSLEVGPKAKLVLYEDENYGDKKRELKAGEKVADLHRSILSEGVESLQLICTQQ
jgi:hypothetical protein